MNDCHRKINAETYMVGRKAYVLHTTCMYVYKCTCVDMLFKKIVLCAYKVNMLCIKNKHDVHQTTNVMHHIVLKPETQYFFTCSFYRENL